MRIKAKYGGLKVQYSGNSAGTDVMVTLIEMKHHYK